MGQLQMPPSYLTSKGRSSSISSLHFSPYVKLLTGEFNGDWGRQGTPDIDSANGEQGGKDDTDSSINKS